MNSASGPLRLAVFDCDGTLVDSQHGIIAAMERAWRGLALVPPPAAAVRRSVGLPLGDAVAALAPDQDAAVHAALTEGYRDAYRQMHGGALLDEPLYPGAIEALDALEAAGMLLGIATGKGRTGLEMVLDRHGLGGRFVTLQTSDRAPGKPNPDMLYRAMEEAGAGPRDTVMIGDTSFDMIMAKRAAVAAVGVSWGYHPTDELRAAGADAIIEDYASLSGVVDTLLATTG